MVLLPVVSVIDAATLLLLLSPSEQPAKERNHRGESSTEVETTSLLILECVTSGWFKLRRAEISAACRNVGTPQSSWSVQWL
jgi:hypothetical protein